MDQSLDGTAQNLDDSSSNELFYEQELRDEKNIFQSLIVKSQLPKSCFEDQSLKQKTEIKTCIFECQKTTKELVKSLRLCYELLKHLNSYFVKGGRTKPLISQIGIGDYLTCERELDQIFTSYMSKVFVAGIGAALTYMDRSSATNSHLEAVKRVNPNEEAQYVKVLIYAIAQLKEASHEQDDTAKKLIKAREVLRDLKNGTLPKNRDDVKQRLSTEGATAESGPILVNAIKDFDNLRHIRQRYCITKQFEVIIVKLEQRIRTRILRSLLCHEEDELQRILTQVKDIRLELEVIQNHLEQGEQSKNAAKQLEENNLKERSEYIDKLRDLIEPNSDKPLPDLIAGLSEMERTNVFKEGEKHVKFLRGDVKKIMDLLIDDETGSTSEVLRMPPVLADKFAEVKNEYQDLETASSIQIDEFRTKQKSLKASGKSTQEHELYRLFYADPRKLEEELGFINMEYKAKKVTFQTS